MRISKCILISIKIYEWNDCYLIQEKKEWASLYEWNKFFAMRFIHFHSHDKEYYPNCKIQDRIAICETKWSLFMCHIIRYMLNKSHRNVGVGSSTVSRRRRRLRAGSRINDFAFVDCANCVHVRLYVTCIYINLFTAAHLAVILWRFSCILK